MKKSLLVLGVAVAALASCTNEEVVSMPEGRAIGFNSFVNNNTKAVTEVTSLSSDQFYVFGRFSSDGSQWSSETLFKNELASKNYYWVQGNQYRFGAYADGEGGKLTDVSFEPSTQTLTFSNYTPDDAKDLLAATGTANASSNIPSDPVSLNFSHMLSQVAFTFNTEDGNEYVIAISDISIQKAIKTATGTYTNASGTPAIAWDGNAETAAAYTYPDIVDIADGQDHKESKLVIPQELPSDDASKIQVVFTASITGGGLTSVAPRTFTLDLTSPDTEGWKPGYRYNYTATVNGENIQDALKPITFTTTVTGWEDATMGDDETILPTT